MEGHAEGEGRFPYQGKPPHEGGNQLIRTEKKKKKKVLKLLEDGEVADLWQRQQSENYTDGPCCGPMCPGLGCVSTRAHRGWELDCGN